MINFKEEPFLSNKGNYQYIYNLILDKENSIQTTRIINLCDPDIIDDKMARLALSKGYRITDKSPSIFKNNIEYIYECLDKIIFEYNYNYGHYIQNGYPECIEVVDEQLITEDLALLAINKGYDIGKKSPTLFKENEIVVYQALEILPFYNNGIAKIINNCFDSALSDRVIELAFNKHYQISEKTPDKILNTRRYIGKYLSNDDNAVASEILEAVYNNQWFDDEMLKLISPSLSEFVEMYPDLLQDKELTNRMFVNCSDKNEVVKLFNNLEESKQTPELFNIAIKNGYYLTENSPESFKKNPTIIFNLINNSKSVEAITSTINHCDVSILTAELITIALSKGYQLSKESPKIILTNIEYLTLAIQNNYDTSLYWTLEKFIPIDTFNNKAFVKALIKQGWTPTPNFFSSEQYEFFEKCLYETFDNQKMVERAIKKFDYSSPSIELYLQTGYILTPESPRQLFDYSLLKPAIEYYNKAKITIDFIDNSFDFKLQYPNQETINFITQNGYYLTEKSSSNLKNNEHLLEEILKNSHTPEELTSTINHTNPNFLNDTIINEVIDKGYYIDKNTPDIIKNNHQYISRILSNNKNPLAITSTIDNVDPSLLDNQLIEQIINKHLYLEISFKTPNVVKTNQKYIIEILNYVEGSALNKTILNIDNKLLNLELLDLAIKKGFTLSVNSDFTELNNIIKNNYQNKNLNEKEKSIIDDIDYIGHYVYKDTLFSPAVLEVLGLNAVKKIYKYMYLLGDTAELETIIKNNDCSNLKYLYSLYTDDDNCFNKLDVLKFKKFLEKYHSIKTTCFDILKNGQEMEEKNTIRMLIDAKLNFISFKEKPKEIQYDQYIYDKINDYVEHASIFYQQNLLFQLLLGYDYDETVEIIREYIDSKRIDDLIKNIKDNDTLEILYQLRPIIYFIEKLIKNNDPEDDVEIIKKMNQLIYEKDATFARLRNNLKDLKNFLRRAYEIASNEELTTIDSLKNIVGTYEASSSMNLENPEVKMYELPENSFVMTHVLNAYGTGGKISDFKNPRLIGKTYICLSAIQNGQSRLKNKKDDIDHVTLVFDHFEPNTLVKMAHSDIFSMASNNDLGVEAMVKNKFNTINTNDLLTRSYNEYVVYRESFDGKFIYPSAVLVNDYTPRQADIDALLI